VFSKFAIFIFDSIAGKTRSTQNTLGEREGIDGSYQIMVCNLSFA